MRTLLSCTAVLCLNAGLFAGEPKSVAVDAEKLVGCWEAKGDPEKRLIVFEFARDGGLIVRITRGENESKAEGRYQIEGEKLTLTLKIVGVEDSRTVTVTRFTSEQLLATGEKGKMLLLVRMSQR